MAKLKLGVIADDRPVKLAVELPASIHRDLVAYGQVLARETGQGAVEPAPLTLLELFRASSSPSTRRTCCITVRPPGVRRTPECPRSNRASPS